MGALGGTRGARCRVEALALAALALTPRAFGGVAASFELGNQGITMLALDFDLTIHYPPAGTAALLEFLGELLKLREAKW